MMMIDIVYTTTYIIYEDYMAIKNPWIREKIITFCGESEVIVLYSATMICSI